MEYECILEELFDVGVEKVSCSPSKIFFWSVGKENEIIWKHITDAMPEAQIMSWDGYGYTSLDLNGALYGAEFFDFDDGHSGIEIEASEEWQKHVKSIMEKTAQELDVPYIKSRYRITSEFIIKPENPKDLNKLWRSISSKICPKPLDGILFVDFNESWLHIYSCNKGTSVQDIRARPITTKGEESIRIQVAVVSDLEFGGLDYRQFPIDEYFIRPWERISFRRFNETLDLHESTYADNIAHEWLGIHKTDEYQFVTKYMSPLVNSIELEPIASLNAHKIMRINSTLNANIPIDEVLPESEEDMAVFKEAFGIF